MSKKIEKKNVVIGGAWPYGNNSLHVGHFAALISGDFYKRYHKLIGDNVIYVSGTDCHGTPITEMAKKLNIKPSDIADKYHEEFKNTFEKLEFDYDLYTKTDDEFHKKSCQEMFKRMYELGHIYEKETMQTYCEHCNKFKSDRELELICPKCGRVTKGDQCDCGYIPTEEDLMGAKCLECGNKTVQKANKHLYLALSKFKDKVSKYISENSEKWRIASKNETQKYIDDGLLDRAVSRDIDWGVEIPVEGYEDKRMYVWIEAVLGYITAVKRYCMENNLEFNDFWKENGKNLIYMVHGKDNITFHTVILPVLLMALEEDYHLPDMMISTQYVNVNSEKISKSKGNGITVLQLLSEFEPESLRYYILGYGPENKDIDFTMDNYKAVHNSDLVNKFGNFVNRTLNFKGLEEIKIGKIDSEIDSKIESTYEEVKSFIEGLEIRKAIQKIIELIEIGNKYYDEQKPWIQAKEDKEAFISTVYNCANIIANLSNLLEPVIPKTCKRIRGFLEIETPVFEKIELQKTIELKNMETLFERIK